MIDPKDNYNKVKVQEWSDIFWKKTIGIWLPLVIFYQIASYYLGIERKE